MAGQIGSNQVDTVIIHYPSKKCYSFRINFIRPVYYPGRKIFHQADSRLLSASISDVVWQNRKSKRKISWFTVSEQEQNLLFQSKLFYDFMKTVSYMNQSKVSISPNHLAGLAACLRKKL
jgi:hypothetical protein